MRTQYLFSACFAAAILIAAAQQSRDNTPASPIASGKTLYVESGTKSGEVGNLNVDLGTLHQVGDAIEAKVSQKLTGDALRVARNDHPKLNISEGSELRETQQVVCGEQGFIAFTVESSIKSAKGATLYQRKFDPAKARAAQEQSKLHAEYPYNYGQNAPSLVCWAVARKCEGKSLVWPPPASPNASKDARVEFNKMFVPSCKIPRP